MRVRLYELRLLALLLLVLWSGAFVAILLGYHPGGPADAVVILAAALPVAVAAAGVAWPPLARGERASVVIGWLGVVAALLLVPAISGLFSAIQPSEASGTLLPAPEVTYAGVLALFASCLFSGLGLARRLLGHGEFRRRRFLGGALLALLMTVVVGALFGGAVLANEAALRQRQPSSDATAWGPSDPTIVPPACQTPLAVGPGARVELSARSTIDRRPYGTLELSGLRDGVDVSWTASLESGEVRRSASFVRLGDRSWQRDGGGPWAVGSTGDAALDVAPDLDAAVVAVTLDLAARVAAEDLGIEQVGSARARHCRTATSGSLAVRGFPQLAWLVAQAPTDATAIAATAGALEAWRGEVDWWVFGDGQLGVATVHLEGLKPATWPSGVLGALDARLTALDRPVRHPISAPAP